MALFGSIGFVDCKNMCKLVKYKTVKLNLNSKSNKMYLLAHLKLSNYINCIKEETRDTMMSPIGMWTTVLHPGV